MKIIIAPAKKMRSYVDFMDSKTSPIFIDKAKQLQKYIQTLDIKSLQKILGCSDSIAYEAYLMYQSMNLDERGVPALLAFEGIQYTYMAPHIFETSGFEYVSKHLLILSGFYGVLRPMDNIHPYRLEINNPFHTPFCKSLYDFWKDDIYKVMVEDDSTILDLASAQHSRMIQKYLTPDIHYVKCFFYEDDGTSLKEKGVYVKMARGAMVHYLCEHHIIDIESVKKFNELGYCFNEELSSHSRYVFIRKQK